jgi:hypothetical protein
VLDHHMNNDKRILGDDEFIQFVLDYGKKS